MAEKNNVGMFVTGEDGKRTQVGWASAKDESGVRTFEYSPGYEQTRPKNVTFEDDELAELAVVANQNAPLPAAPIEDAPDETQAAEPIDAGVDETVEISNGGQIVDEDDEDEAEFQRLLVEEQAADKKEDDNDN